MSKKALVVIDMQNDIVISDCVTSYDLRKLDEMFTYCANKGCEVRTLAEYQNADMSKYAPLWEYIKTHAPSELTFDEVRQICGFPIDHSFLNCKKELEPYGYQDGKISMKNQTVKFQRWKQS